MSGSCDQPGEMPDDQPDLFDDETIEAILHGRGPVEAAFAPLVAFGDDVRAVAHRSVPRPGAALAEVLTAGFSTEKGDLLATAGSNVTGPGGSCARQAAGLPKWRKRHSMLPIGFLSGPVTKIVAGVVSALAGVTAVGAAGALPGPAQDAVAGVVSAVTPFTLADDGDASVTVGVNVGTNPTNPTAGANVTAGTDAGGDANASTSVSAGGVQASVGTGANGAGGGAIAGAGGGTTLPTLPNLPDLSDLPNLTNLPGVQIPTCVTNIVDLETGQPKVPLSQIAPQVVSCVRTLMATSGAQLPAGLDQCVSSILSVVGNISPGSVPNISGFDFTKCVPIDVSKCMSSVMGMFGNLVPGFGSGGTGTPNLSGFDVSGCLPFNLDTCLASIFGMAGNLPGLGLGGVPGLGGGSLPSVGSLDLSSCVPFGAMGNVPGLSQFSSLLPR